MRSRSETAGANGARESDSTGPDLTPLQQALGPDEAAVATSPSLLPPRISVGDQVLILAGYRDDPLGDPAPGLDTSAPASGRVIGVEPTAVTLAVDLADLAEVAGPLVDGAATVVVVSADR